MSRRLDDARAIFDAAVASVQADRILAGDDWMHTRERPIDSYDRLFVAGMGKASLALASVLEARIHRRIKDGIVAVPEGYPASLPGRLHAPMRIQVIEGGHPLPNEGSRRAADRMLRLASQCAEGDLLIVLISGGGSALCADFEGSISLEDARETYRLLWESGADIHAVNTVRKHISRIAGGRLAAAAAPADVLALVISDVVGDDLSVIASGPTTGDASTFDEAKRVLEDAELVARLPESVRNVIEQGLSDPLLETPKPDSDISRRVTSRLLGTNKTALMAAAVEATKRGYAPEIIASGQTGEAREVGRMLAKAAREYPNGPPTCLIAGGETTVTIRGAGKGGRNQELALAAAIALEGADRDILFLSGGTDGVDGPTDAAGAWATPVTVPAASKKGFDAAAYLERNDSYSFFLQAGGLLKTGHTHTNVMDVQIILIADPK